METLSGIGGPGGIELIFDGAGALRRPFEKNKVSESAIREMTRLADRYGAINLAQGFPDFDTPEEIKEAAVKAIRDGLNQYSYPFGLKSLREAISEKAFRYNHLRADPETEITVTCGATEGMKSALEAVCNPGDDIIIFEPFHEMYQKQAKLLGLNPKFITLESDFSFDREKLGEMFSDKTAAIIVNTPHNPTGKVFSRDELDFIAGLCLNHDAFAITDEIYEHILYDGAKHISMASLDGMKEHTLTVNAMTKTYAATGWRVGWVISPKRTTPFLRAVHDQSVIQAPTPLQKAAEAGLKLGEDYYTTLADEYGRRREILIMGLENNFRFTMPQGAYYVIADFSPIANGRDDVDFTNHLIRDAGVAVVPGTAFYDSGSGKEAVRLAFCKRYETLERAVQALQKAA